MVSWFVKTGVAASFNRIVIFHLDFVGEALEFLCLCSLIKRAPAGLLKLFKGFILTSVRYVTSLAP